MLCGQKFHTFCIIAIALKHSSDMKMISFSQRKFSGGPQMREKKKKKKKKILTLAKKTECFPK
jgi:hypothetical protein